MDAESERAAVVAWLRGISCKHKMASARSCHPAVIENSQSVYVALDDIASRISSGEHVTPKQEG